MNFITNFVSSLRDFLRRASIVVVIASCSTLAFAQKEMRTYYDDKKQHIQEIFFVSKEDEQKYVGKYQRFYASGGIMLEGNFEDGEKSGCLPSTMKTESPRAALTM